MSDAVRYPWHYRSHKSGVECIQITEHMNFCLGNAVKYIWRCDEKGDPIENLRKAVWYLEREIQRRAVADLDQGGTWGGDPAWLNTDEDTFDKHLAEWRRQQRDGGR